MRFLRLLLGLFMSFAGAAVALASPALRADDEGSLRGLLSGKWLDPKGPFWAPRQGPRTELTLLLGGEAALGELGSLERIPTVGGTTLTVMGRYYPTDRLAIVLGGKGYFGLDRPAAGTTAATVVGPFTGVRWELVRENRFSLQADVQSGPAFFVFADIFDALDATWAVGGEGCVAASLRYSVGPFTGELRPFVGGRVGTAAEIGRPRFEVGPFSALYAGVDLGLTWSFLSGQRREG